MIYYIIEFSSNINIREKEFLFPQVGPQLPWNWILKAFLWCHFAFLTFCFVLGLSQISSYFAQYLKNSGTDSVWIIILFVHLSDYRYFNPADIQCIFVILSIKKL